MNSSETTQPARPALAGETGQRRRSVETIAFFTLLALFLAYGTVFILNSSFRLQGILYFSLLDDAMISMRYARNLAAGYGLVWNPGESPVEGFTNLLWVGLMALVHLFPISAAKTSLVVQIACALLMTGNLILVRNLTRLLAPASPAPALGAVFLTAFYYPLNRWALMGMEVALLCPLVTAAACGLVRMAGGGPFSILPYLCLGIGTLVRPDVAALYLAVWVVMPFLDPPSRFRHLKAGGAVLLLCLGGQTLFRLFYYGEWLPNTYYLKMSGFPAVSRIAHGASRFQEFAAGASWLLILLPFAMLAFRRDRPLALLCLIVLTQWAYSIYIGGDAWERWGGSNRFVATTMPVYFAALSIALFQATGALLRYAAPRIPSAAPALSAALIAAAALDLNHTGTTESLTDALYLVPPEDARANPALVRRAHMLRQLTTPNARIAVVWAGVIPYFLERTYLDMLGKNDPAIARLPMRVNDAKPLWKQFFPGHMKWDYTATLATAPDVIAQRWHKEPRIDDPRYRRYMAHGEPLWLLQESREILWSRVPQLTQP